MTSIIARLRSRRIALALSLPIALHAVVSFSYADAVPNVLMISPRKAQSSTEAPFALVNFSSDNHQEIAELGRGVMYGSNTNVTAILQPLPGNPMGGSRLLVLDTKLAVTLVDTNVSDIHPANFMRGNIEVMAINSVENTIYFPAGGQKSGIWELNWHTLASRQIQVRHNREMILNQLVTIPFGVAVSFRGRDGTFVTLFDTTTQSSVLSFIIGNNSQESPYIYSAPGMGLMEYFNGVHFDLTDTNFSAALLNPIGYPSSAKDPSSKLFFRMIDGHPSAIWGENKSNVVPQPHILTELVIFDLRSKSEAMRMPLGEDISLDFRPDQTGENIYFCRIHTGEILRLNCKSMVVKTFAQTGIRPLDDSSVSIINAN